MTVTLGTDVNMEGTPESKGEKCGIVICIYRVHYNFTF